MKTGYVYILTNRSRSSLYIGVTSDLDRRIGEHRTMERDGFTSTYKVKRLVFVESFPSLPEAIAREKQLKKWSRTKKEWLIELTNPAWEDLWSKKD